ncbi:hypothetical protein Q3C01_12280 [Bradyrhizobium sp. UFLA05-109]
MRRHHRLMALPWRKPLATGVAHAPAATGRWLDENTLVDMIAGCPHLDKPQDGLFAAHDFAEAEPGFSAW